MTITYDELRAKLEHQRDKLKAQLAQVPAPPGNGMGYGTHQADDATAAFEQAANLAIRQNSERLLYQIEWALTRMNQGTYGICQECGNTIDRARLEAIPYSRCCMDCACRNE